MTIKSVYLYKIDDQIKGVESPISNWELASIKDVSDKWQCVINTKEGQYVLAGKEYVKLLSPSDIAGKPEKASAPVAKSAKEKKKRTAVNKQDTLDKLQAHLDSVEESKVALSVEQVELIIGGQLSSTAKVRKDFYVLNGWNVVKTGKKIEFEKAQVEEKVE